MTNSNGWRDISTAPRDGEIFLGWDSVPQLVAWIPGKPEQTKVVKRWLRKPKTIVTSQATDGGWRRVTWLRRENCWGILGGCSPTHWQPLPAAPTGAA
jgi:hypothetical protein